jgi:YVTN family beta-propeller protein
VDYRILGPLEVRDGSRNVELGGDKRRAVLAVLLLHAGEVVSADQLIDDLWGEQPPPAAVKALQAHVSRLRKALDSHPADSGDGATAAVSANGVLVTRGHGYLLRVEPGELDLDRFRELVERGRHVLAGGGADEAATTLRTALAMWRGPPLADFSYEAFAQAPIAQLEELRLSALEERIEADLAIGRHQQLVAELAALVERNPLRERLRGQLMLALYRCGRQAEALEVYQEFRRGMSEQLGLDPGPGLQQLEAAILARDPSLDAPAASSAPAAAPAPERGPRSGARRGRSVLLALVGVALIAATLVFALASGGGTRSLPSIAGDSVGAIAPAGGAITADVRLGPSPSGVAAGDGALWVANYNSSTVSRIDGATHTVQTIPVDSTPSGIAVGAGAVWVANNFSGTVSRINPSVNRVVDSIGVGNGPSGVAVGYGNVWVANTNDGTISRINAVTDAPGNPIALGGSPTGVAVGFHSLWVSDAAYARVLRVDPQTGGLVQPINVGTGPTAIAIGFGSVWVANSLDGTVMRINPGTNHVTAAVHVGDTPNALAVGAGGVWVANEYGDDVVRIDPTTETPRRTVRVGNRPEGVAILKGAVWVTAQASDIRHRGGTLTALQSLPIGSLDPGNPGSAAGIEALYMTGDGLVAFNRVGSAQGTQVVPDLATSVPNPTDGGRIYAFSLRPGIRFSTGQLVRPEDFRRAIERDLVLAAVTKTAFYPPGFFYTGIVGASGCLAHPAHCDLAGGIAVDDAADTVTFHLTAPNPEFLDQLALWGAAAVPASAPNHDVGSHGLPGTGPYKVSAVTPHEVTLVRNPYFHEWSHAAQPGGYPDRIVWRTGASAEVATTQVERNLADYTYDPPPQNRLNEIETRFTNQLNLNPNDLTYVLAFNNRRPPFNDVRVRRAISYAVDRTRVATLFGQDSQPTLRGDSAVRPRVRALLPVYAEPGLGRVERARPGQGTVADRRVENPR